MASEVRIHNLENGVLLEYWNGKKWAKEYQPSREKGFERVQVLFDGKEED